MKCIIVLSILLSSISCSSHQKCTRQYFQDDAPVFYISIAPSFDKPSDFEVKNNQLIYRQYSGLGGYKWGSKKVVASSGISLAEQEKLHALILQAFADAVRIQKEQTENGEEIVTLDGSEWLIQSNFYQPLSIGITNPNSKVFYELINFLESVLEQHSK